MSKEFDVVAIGSGTRDTYLFFKEDHVYNHVGDLKVAYCFRLGSKVEAETLMSFTGGGGSNVCAALAYFGAKTAWAGMVGNDLPGDNVLTELKKYGADVSLVKKHKSVPTNQSIVLIHPGVDRTILVYRGASSEFSKKDLDLTGISAKWIFVGPMTGKNISIMPTVFKYAKENGAKVYANPSKPQAEYYCKNKKAMKGIDIISLNEEEAEMLCGSGKKYEEMAQEIAKLTGGIAVLTLGKDGALACDGKNLYKAGILPAKVVDKTGAGDSFNAGFLFAYMKNADIVEALQFGTANATANVKTMGAKWNFQDPNKKWTKVKVIVKSL